MSGQDTAPWGIEITSETLWVGPMRADGHKVDKVVVSLACDRYLTDAARVKQHANAHLIAAAPELYEALDELEAFVHNLGYREYPSAAKARAALAKARGNP